MDDGWWEGELHGNIGVFPSLVVEELTDDANANVSGAIPRVADGAGNLNPYPVSRCGPAVLDPRDGKYEPKKSSRIFV